MSADTQNNKSSIVNVISILFYVSAGLSFISGLLSIVVGIIWDRVQGFLADPQNVGSGNALPEYVLTYGMILFLAIGVISLATGVLELFIGINLQRRKQWARITGGVLAIGGCVVGILSFPSGIVSLALNGGVAYFLLIDANVKELFSHASPYEKKTI